MAEEGATNVTLPECLLWKILVTVPFPYIFKARLLSKSWLARFQPISLSKSVQAEDEEDEERRLTTSFQKQVVEWSSTHWKTFCPMFVRKNDFIAYDRACNHWQQMPWMSLVPEHQVRTITWWRVEGALLLFELDERVSAAHKGFSLHVKNILTQSCRQLPPRFPANEMFSSGRACTWLILMSAQTYKVVIFDDLMLSAACVYDSKSGAWKNVYRQLDLVDVQSGWAKLNGVLYKLVCPTGNRTLSNLVSFNVEDETFDTLEMAVSEVFTGLCLVGFTVCNGCLVVLKLYAEHVVVRKIDLGSRTFEEVTRGPPAFLNFGRFEMYPASDSGCIFFVKLKTIRQDGPEIFRRVLAYNMIQGEWSAIAMPSCVRRAYNKLRNKIRAFPSRYTPISLVGPGMCDVPLENYEWESSSFRPGLNPFVVP